MPVATNALTTVPDAKAYLKIDQSDTSFDALIEFLINAVSTQLEGYCQRPLKAQSFTNEEFDGTGRNTLLLPAFPVSAITTVTIDDVLVPAAEYKVRKNRGALVRLQGCWPKGIMNIKLSYTGGFATIPADLELACKHTVMFYYKTDVADFSRTFGEGFVLRPDDLPPQTKQLCTRYKRVVLV